jgi:hypothetical protein
MKNDYIGIQDEIKYSFIVKCRKSIFVSQNGLQLKHKKNNFGCLCVRLQCCSSVKIQWHSSIYHQRPVARNKLLDQRKLRWNYYLNLVISANNCSNGQIQKHHRQQFCLNVSQHTSSLQRRPPTQHHQFLDSSSGIIRQAAAQLQDRSEVDIPAGTVRPVPLSRILIAGSTGRRSPRPVDKAHAKCVTQNRIKFTDYQVLFCQSFRIFPWLFPSINLHATS